MKLTDAERGKLSEHIFEAYMNTPPKQEWDWRHVQHEPWEEAAQAAADYLAQLWAGEPSEEQIKDLAGKMQQHYRGGGLGLIKWIEYAALAYRHIPRPPQPVSTNDNERLQARIRELETRELPSKNAEIAKRDLHIQYLESSSPAKIVRREVDEVDCAKLGNELDGFYVQQVTQSTIKAILNVFSAHVAAKYAPKPELAPCPYCNGPAEMGPLMVEKGENGKRQVKCTKCGMGGPWMPTEPEAREAWNVLCKGRRE